MAFIVPTFNIDCNIWRRATWWGTWPGVVAVPDIAAEPCQLRGSAVKLPPQWWFATGGLHVELCLGIGTDVRDPVLTTGEYGKWTDMVEVPSGSGRFYHVVATADQAKGFMNEHRNALIVPTEWSQSPYYQGFYAGMPYAPAWPTPYP